MKEGCADSSAIQTDLDLGSSGAIILKDKNYVITGGKQGPIYLLDATKLGGYEPNANNANAVEVGPCTESETGRSSQVAAPQRGRGRVASVARPLTQGTPDALAVCCL